MNKMRTKKVELNSAELDYLTNLISHEIDYLNMEIDEERNEDRIQELLDEIDKLNSLRDKLEG